MRDWGSTITNRIQLCLCSTSNPFQKRLTVAPSLLLSFPNCAAKSFYCRVEGMSSKRTTQKSEIFQYISISEMNIYMMKSVSVDGVLHGTDVPDTNGEIQPIRPTCSLYPPSVRSRLRLLLDAISVALKAILPRRRPEPTGPFALIFDMVLSIFVPRGACRAIIERLPIHVIGSPVSPPVSTVKSVKSADHLSAPAKPMCTGGQYSATTASTADKCAICLGCYEIGDTVRQLLCGHVFHSEVCVHLFPCLFSLQFLPSFVVSLAANLNLVFSFIISMP